VERPEGHRGDDRLPIGVHFGARLGDEAALLGIAAQPEASLAMERRQAWRARRHL
jgi:Asp-tRNA(Asn)/Glu-tRNA(Gln) amidotransferase A subunit family amidase